MNEIMKDYQTLETLVNRLLHQIEICHLTDDNGHSFIKNTAYLQIRDFMDGRKIDMSKNEGKIRTLRKDLDHD
jgi:hypothetical protein